MCSVRICYRLCHGIPRAFFATYKEEGCDTPFCAVPFYAPLLHLFQTGNSVTGRYPSPLLFVDFKIQYGRNSRRGLRLGVLRDFLCQVQFRRRVGSYIRVRPWSLLQLWWYSFRALGISTFRGYFRPSFTRMQSERLENMRYRSRFFSLKLLFFFYCLKRSFSFAPREIGTRMFFCVIMTLPNSVP